MLSILRFGKPGFVLAEAQLLFSSYLQLPSSTFRTLSPLVLFLSDLTFGVHTYVIYSPDSSYRRVGGNSALRHSRKFSYLVRPHQTISSRR
jgi:hypothetical protein